MGAAIAGVNFPYLVCLKAIGESIPETSYQAIKYRHATPLSILRQKCKQVLGMTDFHYTFKELGTHVLMQDPMPDLIESYRYYKNRIFGG